MSLITGLLAAILALLGLGPAAAPPIPPVPPGLLNIVGTTTLTVHPDLADILDNFGGAMTGTAGGPGGLIFDVTGQLNLSFTEGVIKLNGGVVFTAPGQEPLRFDGLEIDLADQVVYTTVAGMRLALWEFSPLLAGRQGQPVNTPDLDMSWSPEAIDVFNAWTPELGRDGSDVSEDNDGSCQAQCDHAIY